MLTKNHILHLQPSKNPLFPNPKMPPPRQISEALKGLEFNTILDIVDDLEKIYADPIWETGKQYLIVRFSLSSSSVL